MSTEIAIVIVIFVALLVGLGNALLPDNGGGAYRDPGERTLVWPGQ